MRTYIFYMFIGSFFFLSAKGQPYFTVRDVRDTMQFKNGVARTAWLLSSVNNERRHDGIYI
jgi:hypothetical protein